MKHHRAALLLLPLLLAPGLPAGSVGRPEGGLQAAIREVSAKAVPAIVQLEVAEYVGLPGGGEYRRQGLGSGVIIRVDGDSAWVVTNNHVLGDAVEVTVHLAAGEALPGEIAGRDPRRDLALVRFRPPPGTAPARFGGGVSAGDLVLAVGSPLGLSSSVSLGVVSAVGRRGGPGGNISDFIQTDAVINPGNSGGALLNLDGGVVGINTWIASDSGAYEGFGFALPAASVQRSLRDLLARGRVCDGWLGVSGIDPPPAMLEELSLAGARGALVANVYLGGPAERAGVLPGDLLLQLGERQLDGTAGMIQAAADADPGSPARLRLLRRGQPLVLEAVLAERPEEGRLAAENRRLWPGWIAVAAEEGEAVELVTVFRRTPAAGSGFRPGDVLEEVDGQPVQGLPGLFTLLLPGRPAYRLGVRRGDSRLQLDLPAQIGNPGP